MVGAYHIPCQLGDLGERRELSQWDMGRSPSRKRFLDVLEVICAKFIRMFHDQHIAHFGSWQSGTVKLKTQESRPIKITGVVSHVACLNF